MIEIDITDFRAWYNKPRGFCPCIILIQLDAYSFRKVCPVCRIMDIYRYIAGNILIAAKKWILVVLGISLDIRENRALILSRPGLNIKIRNTEHRISQRINNRGFSGFIRPGNQGRISDFKMCTGVDSPVGNQHILQCSRPLHHICVIHSKSSDPSSSDASSASVSWSDSDPAGAPAK